MTQWFADAAYLRADRRDVLRALHLELFEIQEQDVLLFVVVDACFQWQAQHVRAQSHRLRAEDPRIHQGWRAHDRREVHLGENIAFQIDARRNLDEFQALRAQLEYATLGNVEDRFEGRSRVRAGKRAMLHFLDELPCDAIAVELELAVDDRDLAAARHECADEHDLLRILADVDKATGAGQPRPEPGYVQVAHAIGLRQPEEGEIEPTAVVEVELIGLVDDRVRIGRRAEVQPAGRDAADHARLGG